MYPEFIAIYIGLAILIVIGITILIFIIKLNKNNDVFPMHTIKTISTTSNTLPTSNDSDNGNLAFCKKCATKFSASERFCPKCGTPR